MMNTEEANFPRLAWIFWAVPFYLYPVGMLIWADVAWYYWGGVLGVVVTGVALATAVVSTAAAVYCTIQIFKRRNKE